MKLRRVLNSIICFLLLAIVFTLAYTYQDPIRQTITSTVNELTSRKPIIPSENKNTRDFTFTTVTQTNNYEPTNIEDIKKIYYSVLNNGWDEFTFFCPSSYETCIDDVLSVANKSNYLEMVNYYVSPYNNYSFYNTTISTNGEIHITIDRVYTASEIEFLKKYVDDSLLALNINTENPTKSDLKKIHDFIINNTTYDDDYSDGDINSDSNNAIGAIVNHKAICSGYTDAYAIFLDRLNIKNVKLPSEKHIWNYIYYQNKWYHIDLTWDDDEVNKNNNSNFFMIDTKKLHELDKEKHNFDTEVFLETKE